MINGNSEIFNTPTRTITAKVEVIGSTLAFTAHDKLQSILIDRVGENKFFGYGISQKATIKLLDKERAIYINQNDALGIAFNNSSTMPVFYVTDIKRDENTNSLTITAFDVIEKAAAHTYEELGLGEYTLEELAAACADAIGAFGVLLTDMYDWSASFAARANFSGTETIREVLNDIAEVTQTIYYINYNNQLVFKRLDATGAPAYAIDKSKYFTLTSESAKRLAAIVSATELGDNVEAKNGDGETQYIRDNALWALRDDVGALVQDALAAVGGLSITPYNCNWRGNYLVELGDKIALTAKDGSTIETYLLNDTITYTGGYSQKSSWQFAKSNETHTNPATIGEALTQTFAKVDKVNKQIELVVNENELNKKDIAALQINTNSINASVQKIEEITTEALGNINGELATLTEGVKAQITTEQVTLEIQKEISNGVAKVQTNTGFTFDDTGLTVTNSDSEMKTQITEDGMSVYKDNKEMLTASNKGVKAVDLHATTYLIIGNNSRFEDMDGTRTACFWIGG